MGFTFDPLIFSGLVSASNPPPAGDPHWKTPVANSAALPASGNNSGDVRVTLDTGNLWEWNGSTWIDKTVTASSSGPAGAVQFSNGSSGFNSNSSNFFWDNSNHRLGIKTSSPIGALHTVIGGSTQGVYFTTGNTSGDNGVAFETNGSLTNIQGTNGSLSAALDLLLQNGGGNVGIGTTPSNNLTVAGIANFNSPVGIGTSSPYDLSNRPMLTVQSNGGPGSFSTNGIAVIAGTPNAGATYAGKGAIADVNIQNGSNATVLQVPTGTTNVEFFGNIGSNVSSPVSALANTANNIIGSDGTGISGSSISWTNNGSGYTAGLFNADTGSTSNGLEVKIAGTSAIALDVSQGSTQGSTGTSLFQVAGSGNASLLGNLILTNGSGATVQTQNNASTSSQALTLSSGSATGVHASGTVTLTTGSGLPGGNLTITTGNNGASGNISITTPDTPGPGFGSGGPHGAITIHAGKPGTDDANNNITISTANTINQGSGSISLTTGSATEGTTGSITLGIGSTGGSIQFQDGSQGTAGQVWVSKDTSGSGTWGTQEVSAIYYSSGSQTISDSTATPITILTSKTWDSANAFNSGTGVYTIPTAGRYRAVILIATTSAVAASTTNASFAAIIQQGGSSSNKAEFLEQSQTTNAIFYITQVEGMFNCAVNDTLTFEAFTNLTGSSISISGTPVPMFMMVNKIN